MCNRGGGVSKRIFFGNVKKYHGNSRWKKLQGGGVFIFAQQGGGGFNAKIFNRGGGFNEKSFAGGGFGFFFLKNQEKSSENVKKCSSSMRKQ